MSLFGWGYPPEWGFDDEDDHHDDCAFVLTGGNQPCNCLTIFAHEQARAEDEIKIARALESDMRRDREDSDLPF